MESREQLERFVLQVGNGAHVFVPKGWLGETVIVVRQPRPPLQERILSLIEPHLADCVGVYLYGSQARGETTVDSDVDLLVISSKKFEIKQKGFEVVVLPESSLDHAFQSQPLMLCAMLAEAKPIINAPLLEKLKVQYRPEQASFRSFLEDTKRMATVAEGFLEEGPSSAIAYSLILRLRGLYLLNCLRTHRLYSHQLFLRWIKGRRPGINLKPVYDAYKAVKLNTKPPSRLEEKDFRLLVSLLKEEVRSAWRLYGQQKKTPAKGN